MKKRAYILLIAAVIVCAGIQRASAQFYAIKLNALAFATGTINAGMDIALSDHLSLDLSCYWNPIKTSNVCMSFIAIQPGLRFWLYQPHVGTFFGVHSGYARYDTGSKDHRNRGSLTGCGFSIGHSWLLSKRWNFSLEMGAGLFFEWNERRQRFTPWTEDEIIPHARRFVFAPSKAEASFSYLF